MSNVIAFPVQSRVVRNTAHYFGACPHCGGSDEFLNVGGEHWFICRAHRKKWYVGENLFSGWRDESEATWQRNATTLSQYREIEPLPLVAS